MISMAENFITDRRGNFRQQPLLPLWLFRYHAECLFICILLSPQLLSVNTYFIQNYLDSLIQKQPFPLSEIESVYSMAKHYSS